jgi:hypothetical protein
MMNLRKIVPIGVSLALFSAGTLEIAKAQKQAAANPKSPDPAVLGEDHVKALLLLVSDKDKTDKISEQEFLRFMTAEFERLDTNKTGQLDAKDLAQSQSYVIPSEKTGK